MSRFTNVFITSSVLFNLLLAGLIIGHAGRDLMGSHGRYSLQEVVASMPEDKRQHFEDVIGRAEQNTGELRQQLADARKKANNLLRANPFDKAAYVAQTQLVYQLHGQILQHTVGAISELAEQSTPEERVKLADMLRRPPLPPKDE